MEFLSQVKDLGLPGWALVISVLLIVLKYTGVLDAFGDFAAKMSTSRQQNLSFLINHITDRLSEDVQGVSDSLKELASKLGEYDKDIADKITEQDKSIKQEMSEFRRVTQDLSKNIANLGTKVQFVYYEVIERPYENKEELLKIIKDLQSRIEQLETFNNPISKVKP